MRIPRTKLGETVVPDSSQFRRILGHYPTGVCAVTAMSDQMPIGMIVGSFTSVSLSPPLVGFFPDRSSSTWPRIESLGRFCINVLADHQEQICKKLSSKVHDKFASVPFDLSGLGAPIIEGALAWIDCEVDSVQGAGDHFAVLARVKGLDLHHEGSPLIFFRGKYSAVRPISGETRIITHDSVQGYAG